MKYVRKKNNNKKNIKNISNNEDYIVLASRLVCNSG